MEEHPKVAYELDQLCAGNLRPNIKATQMFHFLYWSGFKNFMVRMGRDYYMPLVDEVCFVEFDDKDSLWSLRQLLDGKQVRIEKCMPNRYSRPS